MNFFKNAYLKPFIKMMLTIGIMVYVLTLLDLNLLWQGVQRLSIKDLGLAILFCFFSSLCQALRWCYLTKNHLLSSRLKQILLFWRASFFNLVTPASLGGDIYRVAASRKTQEGSIAFGLIIRERLLGLIAIFLCYLLFFVLLRLHPQGRPLSSFFMITAGFSILSLVFLALLQGGLVFFAGKCQRYISPLKQNKLTYIISAIRYKSYREFCILISLSLMGVMSWVLVFYVLAKALSHTSIHIEELGLVSLVTEIIRWIPLTIQGLGVKEGAAVYTLNLLGHSAETGFLIASLAYLINTLFVLLIGIISFLSSPWLSYPKVNTASLIKVE